MLLPFLVVAVFSLSSSLNSPLLKENNLYEGMFGKQPIEILFFQFIDGSIYGFTSFDEDRIIGQLSYWVEGMKQMGDPLTECILIIHNHHTPSGFSLIDIASYHYLRNKGFGGLFIIYYPATGTVRIKTEGGDDLVKKRN